LGKGSRLPGGEEIWVSSRRGHIGSTEREGSPSGYDIPYASSKNKRCVSQKAPTRKKRSLSRARSGGGGQDPIIFTDLKKISVMKGKGREQRNDLGTGLVWREMDAKLSKREKGNDLSLSGRGGEGRS